MKKIYFIFGLLLGIWCVYVLYAQVTQNLFVKPYGNSANTVTVQTSTGSNVLLVDTNNEKVIMSAGEVTGALTVGGTTTLSGAITATDITGSGTVSGVDITGSGTVTGADVTATDDVTAGDDAFITDDIDIGGLITNGTGFWDGAPSPANNDMSLAYFYTEDFIATNLDSLGHIGWSDGTINSTNAILSGWNAAGDSGWTLTQAAGTLGGILRVTTLTGSNNEFYMQMGELGTETYMEFTESNGKEVWVEYRVADTDTSASAANFFIGLAEEGSAQANFIADAGNDIADLDVVGFVQWEAADDTVQFIYQTSGGAFVDTFKTQIGQAQTTYGIYFDGDSTISAYINGTLIGSVEDDATGFPTGEELSPIIGVKQGAQDRVLDFDWHKFVVDR